MGYEPLQSISKNPDFIFCQSFQNLRLGSINLDQRVSSTVENLLWDSNWESNVKGPMWETTFPRLTHAGLGKPINEDNMRLSKRVVIHTRNRARLQWPCIHQRKHQRSIAGAHYRVASRKACNADVRSGRVRVRFERKYPLYE